MTDWEFELGGIGFRASSTSSCSTGARAPDGELNLGFDVLEFRQVFAIRWS